MGILDGLFGRMMGPGRTFDPDIPPEDANHLWRAYVAAADFFARRDLDIVPYAEDPALRGAQMVGLRFVLQEPKIDVERLRRLSDSMANWLGYEAGQVEIRAAGGFIYVFVPAPWHDTVDFGRMIARLPTLSPGTIYLGERPDGSILSCTLNNREPHAAIVGTTGAGKTKTAWTILASLMLTWSPDQVRFIIYDPNPLPGGARGSDLDRRQYAPMEGSGYLYVPICYDAGAFGDALADLRSRQDTLHNTTVIVADDAAGLSAQPGGRRAVELLAEHTREGRKHRVYVVGLYTGLTAAHTQAGVAGVDIRYNLATQIVGLHSIGGARQSQSVTGRADLHLHLLRGPGDCRYWSHIVGHPQRVQVALVTPRLLKQRAGAGRPLVTSRVAGIDRLTWEYLDAQEVGGRMSISELQAHAHKGHAWAKTQFGLLERAGFVARPHGENRAGVKARDR